MLAFVRDTSARSTPLGKLKRRSLPLTLKSTVPELVTPPSSIRPPVAVSPPPSKLTLPPTSAKVLPGCTRKPKLPLVLS